MKTTFYVVLIFFFTSLLVTGQTYTSTGSMNTDRFAHETQLLYNGKVLAFGGDNFNGINQIVYSSAQLYNPLTGTWSNTGSMNKLRTEFASVVLPNGNVMAIGGQHTMAVEPRTASCEIYNVQTGTWSYADSMNVDRSYHNAIVLRNGKVLVVGGIGSSTCELYNPSTNKWSFTDTPSLVGGDGTSLVMLADGKILATSQHDAEIYNPDTETWTAVMSKLIGDREGHSSVLLNNGNVLITGGFNTDDQTTAEIFNTATMTFTATAVMSSSRAISKAILMDDGKVLAYGLGDFFNAANTKIIEVYDPATATWSSQVYHTIGTQGYNINKLGNGKILISGGSFTTLNGATPACFLIDQNLTACTLPSITMTASGQATCYGNAANVILNTSENGMIYKIKSGTTQVAQATGTGSSLTIPLAASAIQAGDNVYTVYANRPNCTSLLLTDTAVVKASITTVKPVITRSSNAICAGDSALFSAPAGYSTYKWNTRAATSSVYIKNNNDYSVEVTAANGCRSLPSDPAHVAVNPVLPVSISISVNKTTIIAGDAAVFTATSTNGGAAPVYTWSINNIASGNSSTFSTTALQDGDIVSCTLVSNAVCATPSSLKSNSITMIVKPFVDYPKVVSTFPASNALNVDSKQPITITFSKPMSDASATDTIFAVYGSYSGKLKGSYTKTGNSITFTANQYYLPGEKISVMIDSAATDLSGIRMEDGYILEFIAKAAIAPATFITGKDNSDYVGINSVLHTDINNDGLIDIIAVSTGGLFLFLNNGNAEFSFVKRLADGGSAINSADYNGDGYADISLSQADNKVLKIYYNTKQNDYTPKSFPLTLGGEDIITGDFDGDADLDVALKSSLYTTPSGILIQWNDGKGNFNIGGLLLNTNGNSYKSADIDNDGDLDILTAYSNLTLLKNNGRGEFSTIHIPNTQIPNEYPEIVAMGDFDKNGFIDPIIAYKRRFGIIKNLGNENFMAFDSIGVYTLNVSQEYPVADFDGDGNLDLMMYDWNMFTDVDDTISIWKNKGDGTLTKYSRYIIPGGRPAESRSFISADFDSDNDIDIGFVNFHADKISMILNGGSKPSIANLIFTETELCASSKTNAIIYSSGQFASDNQFHLQLSDKNGSFASPTNLISSDISLNNSILAIIPASVVAGTKYRIRAISTNPVCTSLDNGYDIAIKTGCIAVTNITPELNEMNVTPFEKITTTFTQQPSAAVSTLKVYGSLSGSYSFNKGTYTTTGNSLSFTSNSNFFPGEKITVIVDTTLKSTSGQKLAQPFISTFTVESKTAPALFSPYKNLSKLINSYVKGTGDLDNDRDIDVIVRDYSSDSTFILLNDGDGSYSQIKSLVKKGAEGYELNDFDRDGDLDIAITLSFGNITIYLNDGHASFTESQTIDATCFDMKSCDINGDGYIDLVVLNRNMVDQFNVYINDGTGKLNLSLINYTLTNTSSFEIGDIDNDGDIDIIYGTQSELIVLYNTYFGQSFRRKVIATGYWDIFPIACDFNNDNLLDIAGNGMIILNDIENKFTTTKTFVNSIRTNLVVAADFNGDDRMDLLLTDGSSQVAVYTNNASTDFTLHTTLKSSYTALPADLDNDGDIDLISYSPYTGVVSFLNDLSIKTLSVSSQAFCSTSKIEIPFESRGVPAGTTFSAQLSDATGSFNTFQILATTKTSPIICSVPSTAPIGNSYRIRIVCDSLHLIGTDNGVNLTIKKDCPSISTLSPQPNANTVTENSSITVNLTSDVLSSSVNSDNVRIFKNYSGFGTPKGTLSMANPASIQFNPDQNYFAGEQVSITLTNQLQNTDYAPLAQPFVYNFHVKPKTTQGSFYVKEDIFENYNEGQWDIKAADLDNDGDLDIVTINFSLNKISVRLNNNGIFSSKVDYANATNPYDLCLTDIDADGDVDILTANYSGEHISVLKNDGNANFAFSAGLQLTHLPQMICSADFDGDGDMDIASANTYSFSCSKNDGTGNFKESFVLADFGDIVYVSNVTAADIDGDGDIDIIGSTYAAKNSIFTLINDGFAHFTHKDESITQVSPYEIYTADLNNDGKIDLAYYDGSLSIKIGINTNGTFLLQTIPTTFNSSRLELGDIDGDGDIDLVVANTNPGAISTYKNNGSASFTPYQFIMLNPPRAEISILADIDNDRDLDLIMTGANTTELRLLLNTESSITTQPLAGSSICGGEPFTVSFKSYGTTSQDSFTAELSDANGSFSNTPTVIGTGTTSPMNCSIPTSTAVGNGYRIRIVSNDLSTIGTDNGTDIHITQGCLFISTLTPDRNSKNLTAVNSITTNFTTDLESSSINAQSYRVSGSYSGLSLNDGTTSLSSPSSITFNSNRNFFPNEKVSVSLTTQIKSTDNVNLTKPFVYEFNVKPAASNGKFFFKKSTYNTNPTYHTGYTNDKLIKSGDFDNDGDLDVAMIQAGSGQLSIYLNSVKKLTTKTDLPCTGDPRRIEVIDVDSDGDLDILTVNSYNISLYSNNGNGDFLLKNTFVLSYQPVGIAIADYNGDGNMDFATCAFPIGISINTNTGQETFSEQTVTLTESSYAIDVVSMDIDSDGDIDLLAYSSDPFYIFLFENDGTGRFSYKKKISTLSGAVSIQVADFNNDKKMDFITPKNLSGGFYIGLNNGTDFTISLVNFPYYQAYFDLADVDGDGDTDLICSSESNTEGITIMKNDGTGIFTISETLSINAPIVLFTMNDIDNDGDLDIVCANADNKGLLTFYNDTAPDDDVPTAVKNGSSFTIQVYPNPASDYINIDAPDQIQEIIVYNVLGHEVLKAKQEKQINVSELASGIYNIKIITVTGTSIQKVCVE